MMGTKDTVAAEFPRYTRWRGILRQKHLAVLSAIILGVLLGNADRIYVYLETQWLQYCVIHPRLRPDGNFDLSGLEPAFDSLTRLTKLGYDREAVDVLIALQDYPDDNVRDQAQYLMPHTGMSAVLALPVLQRELNSSATTLIAKKGIQMAIDVICEKNSAACN